ncbi:MAG: trehalose-phosphatase [Geminicoccaceae bacterium]|jgi:alpha,alpha-trehalase|nr:trehalose-phosphatase [Geminicoccaceae bacterium]
MSAAAPVLDPSRIDAVILDMDGVLTDTARTHEAAWKTVFDAFLEARDGRGFAPFTTADYRRHVDGKPRLDGVRDFLASRGIDLPLGGSDDAPDAPTIRALGRRKNQAFLDRVAREGVSAFADAVAFVDRARRADLKVAAISASRNAEAVLTAAGIRPLFQVLVDGTVATAEGLAGKPAPDVFLAAVEALGVPASRAAIVEDAVAGIEAGCRGGFGLVVGVARDGETAGLAAAGAASVVASLDHLHIKGDRPLRDRAALPDALASIDAIVALAGDRVLHLFLDYDGTLTPIVERPEDAILDETMRQRVRQLAGRHFVAVISGRGLGDLVERVGLRNLFFAGSHGFELRHPDGRLEEHDEAQAAATRLGELGKALAQRLGPIAGVQLERKRFGLAVHYRRVGDAATGDVERAIRDTAAAFPELTVKAGKKVFEFVPALDWDKGKALSWILDSAGRTRERTLPVYIGDDVTDEDAFRAIEGWGIGIAVGQDGPQSTAAHYRLADVAAVGHFLDRLAERLDGRKRSA